MSKVKSIETTKRAAGDKRPSAASEAPKADSTRETIESIIIALILAFLFRTFEAEAFEIPTGSMGPTLLGRNKDVNCPKCGFPFQAGVSFEVDDYGNPIYFPPGWRHPGYPPEQRALAGQPVKAQTCTCPQCRYTMSVDPERKAAGEQLVKHPYSYKGDRIWVSKAPYVIHDPRRWDVTVFKFPLGSNQNYIKRIVGLPNEKVMIHRGNIHTSPCDKEEYTIERKPPSKVLATLQPVYDTNYFAAELPDKGWPLRWQSEAGAFETSDQGRTYDLDVPGEEIAWLGYRHLPPNFEVWRSLANSKVPDGFDIRPQLVSDFCGYNTATNQINGPEPEPRALGLHWVGDLSLACDVDVQSNAGELTLALVEGGRLFQATFDIQTGQARLAIEGLDDFKPTTNDGIKGPGSYRLRLANIDDQLILWVNGRVATFDRETAYPELDNHRPTQADLTPARIGGRRLKAKFNRLSLERDIYYIASTSTNQVSDYEDRRMGSLSPGEIDDFMSNPDRWQVFDRLSRATFDLGEGQFLALGDNSPNSGDSRYWPGEHFVSRELIIGKAFYVYWPHAWETTPSIGLHIAGRDIRLPFYPNFWEMRLIR